MAKPTGLVHRDMHSQMIADRDAEIARLRAEVERLRANEAELVDVIFTDGEAAGIPAADNSPTEVLSLMCAEVKRLRDALADEHLPSEP